MISFRIAGDPLYSVTGEVEMGDARQEDIDAAIVDIVRYLTTARVPKTEKEIRDHVKGARTWVLTTALRSGRFDRLGQGGN